MPTKPVITTDPSRLAPDDVYLRSPTYGDGGISPSSAGGLSGAAVVAARRTRDQRRNRSRSKRRKGAWKKLLWVRQSYPDNYTDEETFLDHLQRNPRLQPYQFWPLAGESTVIIQQICTMILFVCCFVGIIQERLSPVTIVTWASVGTILGWMLWDAWVGKEETLKNEAKQAMAVDPSSPRSPRDPFSSQGGLGLSIPPSRSGASSASDSYQHVPSRRGSTQISELSRRGSSLGDHDTRSTSPTSSESLSSRTLDLPVSKLSPRNQRRVSTLKSALLIYCALLGLSPILKSLTKSTASDSIWAISFWLMCINIVFFDYGGGVGATFPASLSTNAALMASTVLASRLPSTTHVFSLTLFSIEVFGLFPVFRRYLRHFSWPGHLMLTWSLVMASGAAVSMILSGGRWTAALFGAFMGTLLTSLAMGLSALWLIGLQRHKNAIIGPWDAARPRLNTSQY